MKRFIALTAASAIALSSSIAPAMSQTAPTQPMQAQPVPDAGATPDVVAPDAGTTASTSPAADTEAALAAIGGTREMSNKLANVSAISKINVVKIGDLEGGEGSEMTAAIEERKDDTTGLQAAIMANPALSAKIKEETIDVSSIIASHVEADGSITLYVN